jgi:hypothetical protein
VKAFEQDLCGWSGLFCSYSDSACRADTDCPSGDICVYNQQKMAPECVAPGPPPPAGAPVTWS